MVRREPSDRAKILAAMMAKPEPEPEDYELERARAQENRTSTRAKARAKARAETAAKREGAALLAAFRASGCATLGEFEQRKLADAEAAEAAEAERDRRQAEYLVDVADRERAKPHVVDLAIALSRAHEGGRPVKLAALMIECGLATGPADAARLVKGLVGKELCAALEACRWVHVGRQGHRRWKPPLADRARV